MEVAGKANRPPIFRSALPGATRVKLTALNPHLICVLCGGYYIDATTIIECLHSFCRTCIIRYLDTSKYCPICEVQVHKTRPLHHIRQDKTLQDLVYKLVPGLFKEEMKRRRDYFTNTPNDGSSTSQCLTAEGRGEVSALHDRIIYTEDEKISLSLELSPNGRPPEDSRKRKAYGEFRNRTRRLANTDSSDRRFLLCPAAVTIAHLKKFIRMKFSLPDRYMIDVYHTDESLNHLYTLMDIAYIYRWKRRGPLRLFYSVYEFPAKKRRLISTDTDVSKETSKEEEEELVTSVPLVVNGNVPTNENNLTEPIDLVKKSPEPKTNSPVPESERNGAVSDCIASPSPKPIDNNNTISPANASQSHPADILTKSESPAIAANNNNSSPENLTIVETEKETVLDSPPKPNTATVPLVTEFQESADENRPINMVMTSTVKKEPIELEETPSTSS